MSRTDESQTVLSLTKLIEKMLIFTTQNQYSWICFLKEVKVIVHTSLNVFGMFWNLGK
jgi:hypothetical protein